MQFSALGGDDIGDAKGAPEEGARVVAEGVEKDVVDGVEGDGLYVAC